MKTIDAPISRGPALAVVTLFFLGALPVTGFAQADVNRMILDELRDLKSRVSALESKLDTAASEAAEAKADAEAARAEAAEAKRQLAAVTRGSSTSAGTDADLDDVDSMFLGDDPGFEGWWTQTSIGGYGEHHLNLGDKRQNDFHRFVLFFNHEFNDRVRLATELELEHSLSGDGKPGEVELEQAFVEFDLNDHNTARAGVMLIPAGIINETHEPTTFFGTERNPVESEIIPSTWWEGGAGFTHTTDGGWQWDALVHSGLKVPHDGSNAFRIRSGRQKVAEADSYAPAATTRIKYTGIPGLEVAATAHWQDDITQSDGGGGNGAWLGSGHVDYRKGGFGLRALGGAWRLAGTAAEMLDRNEQWGGYIEPSYRFDVPEWGEVGFFTRFNQVEAARGDLRQYDIGLNYWPIEDVVFKLDFSHIDRFGGGRDEDIFNIGFGYVF